MTFSEIKVLQRTLLASLLQQFEEMDITPTAFSMEKQILFDGDTERTVYEVKLVMTEVENETVSEASFSTVMAL